MTIFVICVGSSLLSKATDVTYGFEEMMLEHTGLNGRKVSDWLRPFWAQWRESL